MKKIAGLLAAGVSLLPSASAEVEWRPEANMDRQLFPSLVIATASVRPTDDDEKEPDPDLLGDRFGLVGVSIKATTPHAKVKVTLKENDVMAVSTWSGELPKAQHEYFVAPKVSYKFDRLRKATQQVPMDVTFAIEADGKPAGEQSETITIRSINDCPFAVQESEETIDAEPDEENGDRYQNSSAEEKEEETEKAGANSTDLGWMFAAYVNESSPVVDKILKDALATGSVSAFAGYQSGPEDVLREAFAIWKALQDRGIRYSSITTTPASSQVVASQHVRFIDESLENKQANCVDGSVLFASVLRKLGLRTFLVTVPGHMYMGLYLDAESSQRIAIETTMIGSAGAGSQVKEALKIMPELAEVQGNLDKKIANGEAWKSFAVAVATGTVNLAEKKENFDSGDDADYQITDVDEARQDGIMPISYTKSE